MEKVIQLVHGVVWSPLVLWGMLLLGGYFMIALNWLPFRFSLMMRAMKSLTHQPKKKSSLSNLQIIATNLGAVMGIGNMVGVASALLAGGAGALFWMWLSSLVISTLKYSEILLALNFRTKEMNQDNHVIYRGGPMYYMKEGLHAPKMAILYTILLLCSSFGIGNMVASNSMATVLGESFNTPSSLWGIVFMAVMSLVLVGGLKRIVKISEFLVPLLVVLYCGACCYILWLERNSLVFILQQIMSEAIGVKAIAGGTLGMGMKYGMSRGIFSNEAGMGSATLTHVQSEHPHMVEQAMLGFVEVFLDTIVMCSLSGLVILLSRVPFTITSPVMLLGVTFQTYFPKMGMSFVTLSIVFFGFASMIGWYYYGIKCVEYLSEKAIYKLLYALVFIGSLYVGARVESEWLWVMSDNFNGMVLWINVAAIVCLRKIVLRLTKQYRKKVG